jgi:hypothetical protein
MRTLSVETLHTWLQEGRAVSLVDVRPTAQRAEGPLLGVYTSMPMRPSGHMTHQRSMSLPCLVTVLW